jgi:hypothetical protein
LALPTAPGALLRNAAESRPSRLLASAALAAVVAESAVPARVATSAASARPACGTLGSLDSLISLLPSVFVLSFLPATERFLRFLPLIVTAA